jgi:protein-tyrosine phosphatase
VEYSEITESLYIGTTPRTEDYDILRELGIRLVINMRIERAPFPDPHKPPILSLWLPTFDSPLIPIPLGALYKGVMTALKILDEGGKVYAHCAAGVHRGVAMGAAILIAQGYAPMDAMQHIKQRRTVADPFTWYIRRRILRFAEKWNTSQEAMISSGG